MTIEEALEIIAKQSAIIAKQAEEIAFLRQRLSDLERRLGLDSTNSSKPPSSEGLRKKPSPQSLRTKGEKKRGGQKGHKGTTLAQVASPTHIVTHTPATCAQCHKSLGRTASVSLIKRQVFDIPVPRIEVTEHQAEVKICACCQHRNVGIFPADVRAPVQYGGRVQALAVYLSAQQFIPEDRLKTLFEDVFTLNIATGTLTKINQTFAEAISGENQKTLEALKKAPVKNMDETGFRVGGKTFWLHVLCSATATFYRVSPKRGSLWEGVKGTVVHDHWKPYFTMPDVNHALCNAHHLRELKALEDIEKEPWAKRMRGFLTSLSRYKDVRCLKDPQSFLGRVDRLYEAIVAQGLAFHEAQPPLGGRKKRIGHNLLLRFKNFKGDVLRFLTDPHVPFTNNQAEQDVRMMKVKQKISGGFRTLEGAETFCQIRSFLATARKQGQNLFQALSSAIPA